MSIAYRAALVVPVSSPPIPHGTVEVSEGRIVGVHSSPVAGAIELPNAAIIPAPINAHTHLEFGDLERPLGPPLPFTGWLKAVIADRRGRTTDREEVVRQALRECAQAGTAAVGEIATRYQTGYPSGADAPKVVAFHESIGLRPERIAPAVTSARESLTSPTSSDVVRGLSPHAPYTVHPELLRHLVALAFEFQAPMAMHLGETKAERQLLQRGTGEFVDFLTSLGAWDPQALPPGRTILDTLRDLASAPRVLVVHGNYLSIDEVEFLAGESHFSVVYCPRTHHYFGHEPHQWRSLIARGARVVLGTDSRASNPDLSVWREACFLTERFPDAPRDLLLRMITLDAATALGLEQELGSIEPGKAARLQVAKLPEGSQSLNHLFWRDTLRPLPERAA